MVARGSWIERVESAWRERRIVWLAGVRRTGKTFLSQSLPEAEYFDCELPRVRRLLEDTESFLGDHRGKRIVLDEIHRLANPSEVLKIASDHYPDVRILATGSSTLGASAKFRDTLAGRKRNVWLTPMTLNDLDDFGRPDLRRRLLRGGLPPFFLARSVPERDVQDWIDDYWAKDLQELFRVDRRASFQRFLELLFTQSGGIFEATAFAGPCEVSRSTIANYLAVLEATLLAHIVRPFSARRSTEIVAAPKVYGFDTGFVCHMRGWRAIRDDDLGVLWEHFVLNEIQAQLQTREIRYWRDKRKHEIDFVLAPHGRAPQAIECKWSADSFDPVNLLAFRRQHPEGASWVVAADVDRSFVRSWNGVAARFVGLRALIAGLSRPGDSA
jgi:predicted AAA+ superfamily ATPase